MIFMIRQIIKIDEEKCNGCGLCVNACHEGAIQLIDGKAKLTRDDYCDGLGNCLPVCPTDAISFVEREAEAYDSQAVMSAKDEEPAALPCGCPGTHSRSLQKQEFPKAAEAVLPAQSELRQWPVQIKLVPVNAPYFKDAGLLIAADCTAYACGDFHTRFMKNKITIIGCPKLDDGDYAEKLTAILTNNDIKSVTVARMEVPCCGGLASAAITALKNCGKMIPWNVITIGIDGEIIE
jgi:NAD-dependent dihydropyrimidine dehydrogenase PreA subunit